MLDCEHRRQWTADPRIDVVGPGRTAVDWAERIFFTGHRGPDGEIVRTEKCPCPINFSPLPTMSFRFE